MDKIEGRVPRHSEIQRRPLADNLVKSSESSWKLPELVSCFHPSVAMIDSELSTIKSTQTVFSSGDWYWLASSRMPTAESMDRLEMI